MLHPEELSASEQTEFSVWFKDTLSQDTRPFKDRLHNFSFTGQYLLCRATWPPQMSLCNILVCRFYKAYVIKLFIRRVGVRSYQMPCSWELRVKSLLKSSIFSLRFKGWISTVGEKILTKNRANGRSSWKERGPVWEWSYGEFITKKKRWYL